MIPPARSSGHLHRQEKHPNLWLTGETGHASRGLQPSGRGAFLGPTRAQEREVRSAKALTLRSHLDSTMWPTECVAGSRSIRGESETWPLESQLRAPPAPGILEQVSSSPWTSFSCL